MTGAVALHKPLPQKDIVASLRKLADDMEAGVDCDLDLVTTCSVVIGHSHQKELPNGEIKSWAEWSAYAWGPRTDVFTVRGLLASVIARTPG